MSVKMAAWDLCVSLEELGPEAPPLRISVTSDLHIGGVILRIVEKTRKFPFHTRWGRTTYSYIV